MIAETAIARLKMSMVPVPLSSIVAVRLGISYYKVNLKALDAAYSIAFPNSTPINVNKKKK
jgi:hypothetical protein